MAKQVIRVPRLVKREDGTLDYDQTELILFFEQIERILSDYEARLTALEP